MGLSTNSRRVERGFALLVVAFVVTFLSWLAIKPNGAVGLTWFSDIALSSVAVTSGVLSIALATRLSGNDRRSWALLGAGMLSWGIGQVVWSYYELILQRDTPFPSPSDAGYLGLIPLMLAGLVMLPSRSMRQEERIKIGLDGLIIMASIATFSWFAVLGPIYGQSDSSWLEKLIGLAYPGGDVILMCALIGGMSRGWIASRNPAVLLLIAGIISFIIADFGFAFLTIHNDYASGSPIDLGWPLGFLLVTFAVIMRWSRGPVSIARVTSSAPTPRRTQLQALAASVPYLLVLCVAGLMYASRVHDRGSQWNVFMALALSTVILVIARQFVTVRENERLNRELRGMSEGLERLVQERTARLASLHDVASALSRAASIDEVCQIALQALCDTIGGASAVLYVLDRGAVQLVAAFPRSFSVSQPIPDIQALAEDVVIGHTEEDAETRTVLVRISERGEARGAAIVFGVPRDQDLHTRTLSTIGSELGVAYENQRRFEEMKRLADRDPTTGLYNARYLHTTLDRLIEGLVDEHARLSLVIGDIDDFKLFNDTYGHPAGDEVLQKITGGLLELCPEPGFTARFGGDEFAVVLPNAGRDVALEFVQAIQTWAEQQAYQQGDSERIPIRLSFGMATYPDNGRRRYELVAAADANLYDAKRSGSGINVKELDERREALRRTGSFSFLEALVTSVDNKDQYTKRHCDLVSEFAVLIAEGLQLSTESQRSLAIAGALHDVGKICIPDRILRKPSGLTAEEYETIKLHVPLAANLIQHVPRRKDVLDGVLNHHERFDGTGYPKGTKGKEIPLIGRIMAVADAFSAMTLDRPYRKALPFAFAFEELRRGAGTQFDPEIVDIFIRQMEERIRGQERAA
jgi:diguanylate cyclase (GGDEF)-like protein